MTSKDSINSRDKEIHSDQNDSRGVKYGCIIFCLLSAFMLGIVINIVLTGIRTVEEILPHTDENPIPIPEEKGTETEVKTINLKIDNFINELDSVKQKNAELALTSKDINILISNNAYLSDLKGAYFFESISNEGEIKVLCSRKIRKFLPWKDRRYWNGEMNLYLEVLDGRVFLRVKSLKPSNGSIMPNKIVEKWATQDQLEMYKNDESFLNYTKRINSARFENKTLILSTKTSTDSKQSR
tara:strand:+ start:12997 stop:13719 length:723 start_codon:yes stop_codon:yes gene_type:complete